MGAVAVVLAAVGIAWQYAGVQFAFFPVFLGVPLAFAVDHLLWSPAARSIRASLAVAVAVCVVAFCAIVVVVFEPAGRVRAIGRRACRPGRDALAPAARRLTRSRAATRASALGAMRQNLGEPGERHQPVEVGRNAP